MAKQILGFKVKTVCFSQRNLRWVMLSLTQKEHLSSRNESHGTQKQSIPATDERAHDGYAKTQKRTLRKRQHINFQSFFQQNKEPH